MKLLGVCGSLRKESTNAVLLAAALDCVPSGNELVITDLVGELPHFNPDIEPEPIPVLARWIQQAREADGIIFSTPEYARGYPGALKNALDWLVQTDAHIEKPFMFLSASGRSKVGQTTLTTVLETMSGIHIEPASITVSLLGKTLTADELLSDDVHRDQISAALQCFVDGISARAAEPG